MKKNILSLLLGIAFIFNDIYAITSNQHKHKIPHKVYRKKHHKRKLQQTKAFNKITPVDINLLTSELKQTNKIGNTESKNNTLAKPNRNKVNHINHNIRLYSYSAMVINAKNGDVIVDKNSEEKLSIASISKLMTAMVILDSNIDMDDYVTISSDDIDTIKNTYSRLKVGMSFTRRDLLLLALMSSENRATHALARTTFKGGINAFINKMNNKAIELKMYNTKFYDPTGLTYRNTSTAYDLARMVQKAYEYDEIRIDTTTKNANVMLHPKYIHKYVNSDALIRSKNNKLDIKLSKTGFINEAGHCLALYTIIENKPIIMVFLNSAGASGRLLDALTIKSYIERNDLV